MKINDKTMDTLVQVLENHHIAIDAILEKLDMKGKIKNPNLLKNI